MGSESIERAINTFSAVFGGHPVFLTQAPGRVNLIGEHTDYNDGLVLPAAIERYVAIAARPAAGPAIRLHAATFGESVEIPADNPARAEVPRWARYPQGVAVELARRFPLRGVEGVVASDLPIGSGLSSSAALEVASSLALECAAGQTVGARDRALLCWRAEVEFVGVPCGIMDQFASTLSRRGHTLFLDCRSQETHHIPLPPGLIMAVCDTGARRTLANSFYGTRRRECADAVALLKKRRRSVQSLRDLSIDDLTLIDDLPDPLARRARHVVTENDRVVRSAQSLESGEVSALRDLFEASQASLRADFEVSAPELEAMVKAALASPGCLAARMTGAGFGGAVVALVQATSRDVFAQHVVVEYHARTQREGVCFLSGATEGAHVLELT